MDSVSLNQTPVNQTAVNQTTNTIDNDAVDGMPGLDSTTTKKGKLASRKVDLNVARELASAVIKHDLPFSFVEYDGYICLTGHFVDENWKLNSKILCFAKMPPPHTGVELAAKIYGFLKEWGIERKVFSLTLDNASSHILNLIVQEGLKVVTSALHKIRDSVKYVKGSEGRMKKFEECINAVGNIDTSIGLRLDVVTRWNSTYLMLESAIKYKTAFASLQLNDRHYKFCPSNEEWKRGEKICEFLESFYEVTNLISGSSYPTSNLYFMQVWKIESMLKENLHNEDVLISAMCRKMFDKFDKYWSEYSLVLAFGAIFDPRIKLVSLEHLYEEVESDPIKVQDMVSLLKTNLNKLFSAYANIIAPRPSQPQVTSSSMQSESLGKTKGKRAFEAIKKYDSRTVKTIGKSELEIYLEEPKLEYAYYEDLNILDYWKEHTEESSNSSYSTSNLSCEDSNVVNLVDENEEVEEDENVGMFE
ncbi:zinc finger BED domain-containing protein RICESLEEPER 2-like [Ipomoea triloba]|uniref:zinc finger BED domain-containing protein RICESLEEPER 2-like n=1 Tax=Ipomoea triloba TaxID=35885 RepID=UPI00125DE161|nr:zinc finger BED domain-containing protein RICESLEEPER 2-like [Ipomoea triloba]